MIPPLQIYSSILLKELLRPFFRIKILSHFNKIIIYEKFIDFLSDFTSFTCHKCLNCRCLEFLAIGWPREFQAIKNPTKKSTLLSDDKKLIKVHLKAQLLAFLSWQRMKQPPL